MRHTIRFLFCLAALSAVSPARADSAAQTVTIAGAARSFRLTAGETPPRAILIALHPRPASGAAMRHISGLDARASEGRYAVAYPDGVGGAWNAEGAVGPDDEAFLLALAKQLRQQLKAPTAPIYLVGVSNGAAMAERLILDTKGVFAGAALISGGVTDVPAPLAPTRPPGPIMVMVGDTDQNVAGLTAAAQARRARYGCRALSTETLKGAEKAVFECQGARLEEWRMRAGHVWPGAVDSGPLSWPDAPFRASDEILRLFGLD